MISINRVICPLDFSVVSRSAVDYALALARQCGASVTALHVELPPSVGYGSMPPPGATLLAGAHTHPPGSGRELLAAATASAVGSGLKVEHVVEQGNVVERILSHVTSPATDLLVLGTHGTGGFERLVLGSVTEKIIRKASCPVVTVSPEATDSPRPWKGFHHLLCAIDFSDASLRALEYALTLADDPACELTLLHVLEPPTYGLTLKQMASYAESDPRIILQAEARLEALLPDTVDSTCAPRAEVRAGRVHERILDVSRECGAEAIVMGVHGRGRGLVERLFLGSVANQVVREARCPVLCVRDVTPAAARSDALAYLRSEAGAPPGV